MHKLLQALGSLLFNNSRHKLHAYAFANKQSIILKMECINRKIHIASLLFILLASLNFQTALAQLACIAGGNQISYSDNSWTGYVYDGTAFNTYKGYVTESANFNRVWGNTATSRPACATDANSFSIRYLMRLPNLAAGIYKFTIGNDDGKRLSISNTLITNFSGLTYQINAWSSCCADHSAIYTHNGGDLYLIFEFYEGGGGAQSNFSYCYEGPLFSYGTSSWNGYAFNATNLDIAQYKGTITGGYANNSTDNLGISWGTPLTSTACGGAIGSDNFSTMHAVNKSFTEGFYRFKFTSDDGIRLSSNGATNPYYTNDWNIYTNWQSSSTVDDARTLYLNGSKNLVIQQAEGGGGAGVTNTICQIPGDKSFNQSYPNWKALVYDGDEPTVDNNYMGHFTTTGSDPNLIDNNWGNGQPGFTTGSGNCARSMDNDGYAVRYLTTKNFSNGVYVFSTQNNDDSRRLSVDGGNTWHLSCWHCGNGNTISDPIELTGNKNLVFDMREGSGGARAALQQCQMDAGGTNGSLGNATAVGTSTWNLYYYNTTDYSFPISSFRRTNTGGTSAANSASLNLSFPGAPTGVGQNCGTAMNDNFSLKALLTRTFTKGIYTIQSGADDWSRIRINGSSFINEHGSCCTTQSTNVAFDGNTQALEYQMRETGGPGSTTVNISCSDAVAGTLSSNQACNSTGAVTLSWNGGLGWNQLEYSNDGSTWANVSGHTESARLNTGDVTKTWSSINPTTTTYYRVRTTSCNGTFYSNVVTIVRASAFTGNVTIANNITLGGNISINGNFTLNSGITITVPQGCPLVINATNITINGTINANNSGELGGNGGVQGGYWSSEGNNTDGRGILWCSDKDNCRELKTIGGGAGGNGAGAGGGNGGSKGNDGQGKKQRCSNWDDEGGRVGGSGGGGGGKGGGNGGSGGNGGNGSTGNGTDACREAGCSLIYAVGSGGNGATSGGNTVGSASDYTALPGSGGGGAGGGGTGRDNRTAGANGGNGGGSISLIACNTFTMSTSANISANGSNGGNGGNGGDWTETGECCGDLAGGCDERTRTGRGGAGAGGGGGAGGTILISAFGPISIPAGATLSANGGNGGAGGTSDVNGQSGGGGGGGRVKIFYNPCVSFSNAATIAVNGGTGQNAGNNGTSSLYNHPSYSTLAAGAITSPTDVKICYGTNPISNINADASTGGANNSALSCTAVLPTYEYQWYVTSTACNNPTTGTSSTPNANWNVISGATSNNISAAQLLSGINIVGNTTTVGTYCFQRRTKSSTCYAWTDKVSITIRPQLNPSANAAVIPPCANPNQPYAELIATPPITDVSGIWTIVSGDGTFNDATNPSTNITGLSSTGNTTLVQWTLFYTDNTPACSTSLATPISIAPTALDFNTVSTQSTSTPQYYNCKTCTVKNGNSYSYYDNAGKIMAKVIDPTGGSIEMGSTELCLGYDYNANSTSPLVTNVKSVLTNFGDLQPYLTRYWSISPNTKTGQDVIVSLFFTQAEYDALKLKASGTAYEFADKNELVITKYDNGSNGTFTNPPNYPATNSSAKLIFPSITRYPNTTTGPDYAATFTLNSFSTFYLHPNRFPFAALPVELISFSGVYADLKNNLSWKTASERNANRFEVEKSNDGINWYYIGEQVAMGNSNGQSNYYFQDNHPITGNNYYRLKMIDNDATFEYSNVINITVDEVVSDGIVSVFPNPVSDNVTVIIQATENHTTDIQISNVLGQHISIKPISVQKGLNEIELSFQEMSAGAYVVSYIDNNGNQHQHKIIKK